MVQWKSVWGAKGIRHIFDEKWNGHQELPVCSWNTFYFTASSCYCCHSLQILIWSPYSMRDPFFCMHCISLFSKCSFYLFCLISTTPAVSVLSIRCWAAELGALQFVMSLPVLLCLPAVLRQGLAFSPVYRFSLSDGTIVSAQTKSKLIRSQTTSEPQLVISLHMLHR